MPIWVKTEKSDKHIYCRKLLWFLCFVILWFSQSLVTTEDLLIYINIEELIHENDVVHLWMFVDPFYVKNSVIFGITLLKIRMSDPRQQPAENPGMSVIKLFLAGNTSALWFFSRIRGRRCQEILKFLASCWRGSLVNIFNSVGGTYRTDFLTDWAEIFYW